MGGGGVHAERDVPYLSTGTKSTWSHRTGSTTRTFNTHHFIKLNPKVKAKFIELFISYVKMCMFMSVAKSSDTTHCRFFLVPRKGDLAAR